jgi:hypothetical protein
LGAEDGKTKTPVLFMGLFFHRGKKGSAARKTVKSTTEKHARRTVPVFLTVKKLVYNNLIRYLCWIIS